MLEQDLLRPEQKRALGGGGLGEFVGKRGNRGAIGGVVRRRFDPEAARGRVQRDPHPRPIQYHRHRRAKRAAVALRSGKHFHRVALCQGG